MDFSHTGPLLDNLFHLKLSIFEKVARSVLVYLALILLLRTFGKRELAQLNPFDLVVLLSLANTVQNAIIGDDNSLTGGLIGALSLLAMNWVVARILYRSKSLERALTGSPTRLITNGQVDKQAMQKELLSDSELLTVLHRQGFDDCSEVESCTLEAGGSFFIKGRKPDEGDRFQSELMAELSKLGTAVADLRAELKNRVN